MTATKPSTAWVLPGLDPKGALVQRITEIAAGEHVTVPHWVERWLSTVVEHHYGHRGSTPNTARDQLAATRETMRHNLATLGEQLGRLSRSVEQAHGHTAGAEQAIHEVEDTVKEMEGNIAGRPDIPAKPQG